MNATETLDPVTEDPQARERLGMAAKHAANGLRQAKETVQGAYRAAAATTSDALQQGKDIAQNTVHDAASGMDTLIRAARDCVERNTWFAVFGTLGIGLTLGFLAAHRRPSFQERLVHDPMNTLREALAALAPR